MTNHKSHGVTEGVEAIQDRNRRVELDKAWETSWTRRLIIAALTYVIVALYLLFLGVDNNWFHALVPVAGFLLSTLTIQGVKAIWIKNKS